MNPARETCLRKRSLVSTSNRRRSARSVLDDGEASGDREGDSASLTAVGPSSVSSTGPTGLRAPMQPGADGDGSECRRAQGVDRSSRASESMLVPNSDDLQPPVLADQALMQNVKNDITITEEPPQNPARRTPARTRGGENAGVRRPARPERDDRRRQREQQHDRPHDGVDDADRRGGGGSGRCPGSRCPTRSCR